MLTTAEYKSVRAVLSRLAGKKPTATAVEALRLLDEAIDLETEMDDMKAAGCLRSLRAHAAYRAKHYPAATAR